MIYRSVALLAVLACLALGACGPAGSPAPATSSPAPAGSTGEVRPAVASPTAADSRPAAAASVSGGPPSPAPQRTAAGELTVFAAASLTDAFQEISAGFTAQHPDSRVTFNFGASSQLRAQLEQGASADLFASADQAQMDRAKQANLIDGTERIFARNRLVVIVPQSNPGRVQELHDLARPGLRFVTAAPEVPVGVYTQQMLDKLSQEPQFGAEFKDRVNANIVSREPNVRQVVAKVALGEADAAVVYSSDVTPDVAARLGRLEIPEAYNALATYPIAVVRNAPNRAAAEAFIAYVLSPAGQATLKKWGFIPVADAGPGGG